MLIKKISENKLEIFIDVNDLEENKVSISDFMSSSSQRYRLLLGILKVANKESGFHFKNYSVILESFSIQSLKTFIITITKIPHRIHKSKYKKLKMNTFFLAAFENFEALSTFCNSINISLVSSLFLYNNLYYLNIKIKNFNEFKTIHYNLKEFSINYRINFFISENANLIIKHNAIGVCKNLS